MKNIKLMSLIGIAGSVLGLAGSLLSSTSQKYAMNEMIKKEVQKALNQNKGN